MDSTSHDDLISDNCDSMGIWHAWRKAIHENIFRSPLSTHSFVERFIADLELTKPKPKEKQATQDLDLPLA